MELDLPLIWAGIIAVGVIMYVIMDGFDLGDRHPVPVRTGRPVPRRDDEHGGADLGRQRDLAGPRRRFAVRRLSGRLRGALAGVLPAADHHAPRPGLPRGGVRVPLQEQRQSPLVGSGLRLRLHDGDLRPGRGARVVRPGRGRGRSRLRRVGAGLASPLLAVLRPGADGRLRHARRGLADRQDRGAAAGVGLRQDAPRRACARSRRLPSSRCGRR